MSKFKTGNSYIQNYTYLGSYVEQPILNFNVENWHHAKKTKIVSHHDKTSIVLRTPPGLVLPTTEQPITKVMVKSGKSIVEIEAKYCGKDSDGYAVIFSYIVDIKMKLWELWNLELFLSRPKHTGHKIIVQIYNSSHISILNFESSLEENNVEELTALLIVACSEPKLKKLEKNGHIDANEIWDANEKQFGKKLKDLFTSYKINTDENILKNSIEKKKKAKSDFTEMLKSKGIFRLCANCYKAKLVKELHR